jgi:hypothetical protein
MTINQKERENNKLINPKILWKNREKELAKILSFWEKYKKEWEELKKKFRSWYKGDCIFQKRLLKYEYLKNKFILELNEEEEKIIKSLKWPLKEKFINEYLRDRILYSWEITRTREDFIDQKTYKYDEWMNWRVRLKWNDILWFYNMMIKDKWVKEIVKKMKLKKCVSVELGSNYIHDEWAIALSKIDLEEWCCLNLDDNMIWDDWADAISRMKLKEWVTIKLWENQIRTQGVKKIAENLKLKIWSTLDLSMNDKIWYEWIKAIAEKLELQEWVSISLTGNEIWDEWADVIAKNMKLKEWVELYLCANWIWIKWIKSIAENLELKEWVTLNLRINNIWDEWAEIIAKKMKLKEYVTLEIWDNWITDKWAEILMNCLELKEWVRIWIKDNKLSDKMKRDLKLWEKSYIDRWIKCEVEVWAYYYFD